MNNKKKGTFFSSFKSFFDKHMITMLTIVMVWCSILLYRANKGNFEIEKIKQTMFLQKEFFNWFTYHEDETGENSSLQNLKIWEGSLQDTVLKNNWLSLSDTIRINELCNNPEAAKLFNIFEDAKVLHQKGLLDVEYFINFVYSQIRRMEKASDPTIDTFIKTKRMQNNNPYIYDGYYYCRDVILYLYGNKRQRNAVEYVKEHKKITVSEYKEINHLFTKKWSEKELENLVKNRIFMKVTEDNQICYILL